jgi:GTPase
MQRNTRRSGFAVLLGRPSSGKSTLVNALCGHKVSIVSPVPQTTRNAIRGIVNHPEGQIVLLDTPGLHGSDRKLNLRLKDVVTESLPEADVILYLIDSSRPPGEEEVLIADIVAAARVPVIVVITKLDRPDASPGGTVSFLESRGVKGHPVVQVGGLADNGGTPSGLAELTEAILPLLPESEPWYPEDYYTDQPPHFRIAEIVREQAINRTREEVPHALFVEVADIEQKERLIWARVFIFVERISQQGMLVGKKGATITEIRRESEAALARIFPLPVKLSIQVKVKPKWRRDDATLKRLIY